MRPFIAVVGFTACSALSAQTYVVSSAGGGGFTDLPQAIAAVPDGATLHVRAGTYSDFTIQGKSLTILAETPGTATVAMQNQVLVAGLTPTQHVHVSGLVFTRSVLLPSQWFTIQGCAGGVVLDRIKTSGVVLFRIGQCSDVHLLACTIPDPGVILPSPRLRILGSNVEIADSTITSSWNNTYTSVPVDEAVNVDQGSMLTIVGSVLVGGSGIQGQLLNHSFPVFGLARTEPARSASREARRCTCSAKDRSGAAARASSSGATVVGGRATATAATP
jgi:hypothetical protein